MTSTTVAFDRARAEDRAALIGYLPAGFPSVEGSIQALTAMVEAGCDVIEVGLPYSDPVMDGPIIQAAVQQALDAAITGFGTMLADDETLEVARGWSAPGAASVVGRHRPQVSCRAVAKHDIGFPVGRICAYFGLVTHRIKTNHICDRFTRQGPHSSLWPAVQPPILAPARPR